MLWTDSILPSAGDSVELSVRNRWNEGLARKFNAAVYPSPEAVKLTVTIILSHQPVFSSAPVLSRQIDRAVL
jgi:hypothetical protein